MIAALALSILAASPPSLAFRALAIISDDGITPAGTATVYTKRFLLTNAHMVKDAPAVMVQCADQQILAYVLAKAPSIDMALLGLSKECSDAFPSEPAAMQAVVGESLWAIGFPVGHFRVTAGVSSSYRMVATGDGKSRLLVGMTDAGIEPGSSGGPVVNEAGELVGVVTGRICDKHPQGDVSCKGAFVPIDTILEFLKRFSEAN